MVDVVKEPIRPPPVSAPTGMMAPQPPAVYNTFTDEVEPLQYKHNEMIWTFVGVLLGGLIVYILDHYWK